MEHLNLVANELASSGFVTRKIGNMVEVSLTSRKISTLEVWTELDNKFEGIKFNVGLISVGVLVTV